MLEERLNGPTALTSSQRTVFDAVIIAVENNQPAAFFLDARGGTGKTYLENTLLTAVRLKNSDSIAYAVAASGIAANLLLQGKTFHSRFKAPLNVTVTSTLAISKQSAFADLIRRAHSLGRGTHEQALFTRGTRQDNIYLLSNDHPFGEKCCYLLGIFVKFYQ